MTRPTESVLYERMWQHDEYRRQSPGESSAATFHRVMTHILTTRESILDGASVLDMGCGTGRASRALAAYGMRVVMLDFASNCLDHEIARMVQRGELRFILADLTQPLPVVAQYGFCTDVLEHIPPDLVGAVLDNCFAAVDHCYLDISTQPDHFHSALIGHELHLCVRPHAWWLAEIEARAVVHWQCDHPTARSMFYVSGKRGG